MPKISMLFDHVQRFVRDAFADRLREAGFSSYKGEDIHWYRLVNDEVIQSIYFAGQYPILPADVAICYASHPLYIPPIFQKSPYITDHGWYEQMYHCVPELAPGSGVHGWETTIINGGRMYRYNDILVSYPPPNYWPQPIDKFLKVLSVLDGLQTPRACYEAHKVWYSGMIENDAYLTMSTYFVDEVLYWEDEALYPYCKMYVDKMSDHLIWASKMEKGYRKCDREHLERLLVLKDVFENNGREVYLQQLQIREEKTRKQFLRYTTSKMTD